VKYFEEALIFCTNDNLKATIYSNLGFLNNDIRNYPEVIKYLTQFIELNNHLEDPMIVRAYYVLGEAYYFTEKFGKAQDCFQRVLDSKINYKEFFFKIGRYYASKSIGNCKKAIECFQEAIKLGRDANRVYLYIGVAYLGIDAEDNEKIAKKFFEKITDINPVSFAIEMGIDIADIYGQLGIAYYTIDEYDKSLEYSQKAIDCGIESEILYCIIGLAYECKGCCESLGYYDFAIANLTKAIELDKDYALAYYGLGQAFIRSSLLNTERTAIGIKHIQYAAKLGLPQAQKFLYDNKKLVSDSSKISIDQNNGIYPILY